jgi:hypothetical protein
MRDMRDMVSTNTRKLAGDSLWSISQNITRHVPHHPQGVDHE